MDAPEKIWLLMARTLNGEASAPEQEELMETLAQDDLLRQQYDLLTRIWAKKEGSFGEQEDATVKTTVSRIISRAGTEDLRTEDRPYISRLRKRRTRLVAASFLLVVLAGWFWKGNDIFLKSENKQEAIEARKGSRITSSLPDGTTVWLNAGSKLYYDEDFSGPTREVRLEGEAFFDVVKHPDRPFIVHTSGIDIKVLGTAFNVKSYPEDKTVETTLYRGSVEVSRENDPQKETIKLQPNEKLIVPKQAANEAANLPEESSNKPTITRKEPPAGFTKAHIDSSKKENERLETAWIYSRLEFRGDSFEELARKMERWYNVTILFTDEKVKQLSFNGVFEKESLEQAFMYLKEANSFNYKINSNEISVGSPE